LPREDNIIKKKIANYLDVLNNSNKMHVTIRKSKLAIYLALSVIGIQYQYLSLCKSFNINIKIKI